MPKFDLKIRIRMRIKWEIYIKIVGKFEYKYEVQICLGRKADDSPLPSFFRMGSGVWTPQLRKKILKWQLAKNVNFEKWL